MSTFILAHAQARQGACKAVQEAPDGYVVQIKPPKRSLEQNALLWPLLEAFSAQLQWPVNGKLVSMSPEDWKDVLSAAYKRETVRLAMGLDGGMVMLGLRTSKMSKAAFSEFLEFVLATAADRGVDIDDGR